MSKKKVFMFSGQGTQYFQMGKDLYQNDKYFKYWMDVCNEIVSPLIDSSLTEIIYCEDKKGEPFDRLLHTNPALLSIQYSMARMLNERGVFADFLMGYSLGEMVASVVSEAVALEDGLKLLIDMARLAEEKTPNSKMLAIVAEKMIVATYPDLFSKCWLTATNFPGNFVVCGLPTDIDMLQKSLQSEGITTQQLPLNQGFHTPLIEELENEFRNQVSKLPRSAMKIPIISSLQKDIIDELKDDYFWEVLRYPVNFESTVKKMNERGDFMFIDLGPSGSLATSIKYILSSDSNSVPIQIMNQFGRNLNMLEKFEISLTSES